MCQRQTFINFGDPFWGSSRHMLHVRREHVREESGRGMVLYAPMTSFKYWSQSLMRRDQNTCKKVKNIRFCRSPNFECQGRGYLGNLRCFHEIVGYMTSRWVHYPIACAWACRLWQTINAITTWTWLSRIIISIATRYSFDELGIIINYHKDASVDIVGGAYFQVIVLHQLV